MDSLSSESEQVLSIAGQEAVLLHHDFTGTEHLLLGLLACDDAIAAPLLAKHGIVPTEVRAQVARPPGGAGGGSEHSETLTARAKQVLTLAGREADALDDGAVRPEHLLLGIIRQATGVAALVLRDMGVDLGELREEVLEAREAHWRLVEGAGSPAESDDVGGDLATAPSVVRTSGDGPDDEQSVPGREFVPPLCPTCGARLSEVLTTASVAPAGSNGSGRRRSLGNVTLIFCGACGHTLSAAR